MSWLEIAGSIALYAVGAYALLFGIAWLCARSGGFLAGLIGAGIFYIGGIGAIILGLVGAGILIGGKLL